MREHENKFDDLLLDRLVDGELSETEYREALRSLEVQPDGWRRCALAFLETQAWGREFRAVRNENHTTPLAETRGRLRWSWLYVSAMAVACAASFLLAFGIAVQLQDRFRVGPSVSGHTTPPTRGISGEGPTLDPNMQFASDPNANLNPWAADLNSSPIGRYQLVVEGGSGSTQAVEMPVFAADDPRAGMLLDEYASVPQDVIRALQRNGNDVQRRRNWIPMQAPSGAPMYVPVDEIQVTPVSNRSYQ